MFSFIANLFAPAAKLIDDIHTSDEERLTLRNEFANIQEQANSKLIELEQAKVEALSKVQIAEASSKHFLTANWRPIVSLTLVGLIVANSFGLCELNEAIYSLSEIFLGAYGTSRGAEKIAKVVMLGRGK